MKSLFVFLTLLLCCSCTKQPVLPVIDVDLISVSGGDDYSSLSVKFGSKTDLLNFFQNATGESQLGESLFCSLDKDVEFKDFDKLARYLVGDFVELDRSGSKAGHVYVARLSSFKKEDEGVSNIFMPASELLLVLSRRNVISCKVFTSAYSFGGYYSNSMLIPAADIVRAIQGKRD